ncbi:arginine deiminase [Fusibacter tunisiensis]|uniref:Arginine deiminase n=1 Tax=Fusibacter tunisiensis TaxID=1008308 RepID=A0ABS2MR76_9FIRM|nr:arginine deiminase [Fusibacter tunisiensis]MBM7561875.1 arginine deiminase [Fusibacter tunisiensis]
MNSNGLQIYSEIGKLKKVLLHRPGEEIENLTPDLMERLLFDDIPFLKIARKEHDAFAKVFQENGVEVMYLEKLMAESLVDSGLKSRFITDFLKEAGIKNPNHFEYVKDYFESFSDTLKMVDKMMAGIRREELDLQVGGSLVDRIEMTYPFVVDPMPNLYFTRDPFSTIGNGIALNQMRTVTRRRETLFSDYIFKNHPMFKGQDIPFWYDRTDQYAIEGGDILVLNETTVCIGISERTDASAIERIAKNIFSDGQPFKTILAFDIPKERAFMHLDTVFTMVDHNVFTIHPEIEGPLTVYSLSRTDVKGEYVIHQEREALDHILKKYLEVDEVKLIRCGGKKGIDAGREQWNDGSNTLAISPGEVIVYERNHVTNRLLEEAGIKLHVIPSSELSRGRGGPRCMSMPLYRELIK